jgi:hypothetical protein
MWSFFRKKSAISPSSAEPKRISITAVRLQDDGTYSLSVVGEANYQGALRHICGEHTKDGYRLEKQAVLISEVTNAYDKNAVFVMIDDKKVGYLSREDAADYQVSMRMLNKAGHASVADAIIVGGFIKKDGSKAHYGVRLDLSFPFGS